MTAPPRSERASGVLGTTFGVGVFLVLLYFAAHVVLNLWLASTVDAAAHDAAIEVAISDPATTDRAQVEAEAIDRARRSLGTYGSRVRLTFERDVDGDVVLHVSAPSLRLLPPILADTFDIGGLDRRIVVHPEEGR